MADFHLMKLIERVSLVGTNPYRHDGRYNLPDEGEVIEAIYAYAEGYPFQLEHLASQVKDKLSKEEKGST